MLQLLLRVLHLEVMTRLWKILNKNRDKVLRYKTLQYKILLFKILRYSKYQLNQFRKLRLNQQ